MVFDASVLAKLFVAEDLSDEARRLVGAAGEVWTPAHALAELGEILCRKVALSEIASQQCDLALATAIRLVRTAPLDDLLTPAAIIARETKISVYDALYLALADLRGEELVTWDKRLLRGVQGTRFEKMTRPLLSSWTS
jgi:predicted nucleic acid-binding protein